MKINALTLKNYIFVKKNFELQEVKSKLRDSNPRKSICKLLNSYFRVCKAQTVCQFKPKGKIQFPLKQKRILSEFLSRQN